MSTSRPAAPRAHEPPAPVEHTRLGTVLLGLLGPDSARPDAGRDLALHDQAHVGRGGVAQRHRPHHSQHSDMIGVMNAKPRQTSTDNTAQTGVSAVEAIFLSMKWLFRRQLESDFGIDAQVEVVNNEGNPTRQVVAMQIKSGPSYFRSHGEDYVFRGEPRHLDC